MLPLSLSACTALAICASETLAPGRGCGGSTRLSGSRLVGLAQVIIQAGPGRFEDTTPQHSTMEQGRKALSFLEKHLLIDQVQLYMTCTSYFRAAPFFSPGACDAGGNGDVRPPTFTFPETLNINGLFATAAAAASSADIRGGDLCLSRRAPSEPCLPRPAGGDASRVCTRPGLPPSRPLPRPPPVPPVPPAGAVAVAVGGFGWKKSSTDVYIACAAGAGVGAWRLLPTAASHRSARGKGG